MLRAIVCTMVAAFALGLSCQSCAAQGGMAVGAAPQPPTATQPAVPADGGKFVKNQIMVVGDGAGGNVTVKVQGQPVGPDGTRVIVLGEGEEKGPEGGRVQRQAPGQVPPPPLPVRRAWGTMGGREEGEEAEEHEMHSGVFAGSRRVGEGGWMFPGAPMKMEKAAFLGVSAAPVSEELASQLGLAKGVGLVVDVVDPSGPAKAAGLEKFDVLTKLDDQIVINPPQLQVLVRMHKAGDEIKLTVFRKAKETVLKAKLVEKELPVMGPFWGMPAGPVGVQMRTPFQAGERGKEETQMREAMEHVLSAQGSAQGGMAQASVSISDKEHTITSKVDPITGHNVLTATDTKTGKVLFDGPIDTPEERKAVPPEILKKWEDLQKQVHVMMPGATGNGFTHRWTTTAPAIGPGGAKGPEAPNPAPPPPGTPEPRR